MAEKHALIPTPLAMYPATEAKDASKNLMSNDFEKQYCEKVKSRKWKQGCAVAGGVSVFALVLCLLVLVLMREVQIKRLREEVDELTATVIAMSANVKSLNQKVNNNKFLNDFKSDETIYADEDQDISISDSKRPKDPPHYDSLEKLHGLTVLEDEEDDGEDPLDVDLEDDAESGDWYPDYDSRAEKIGTTNMVHLRPDDFTDLVPTFEKSGDKMALLNNIREIKRLLNENPENPDLPGLLEPTEAAHETKERQKRSQYSDVVVDNFAAPMAISVTKERRKPKKFSANLDSATEKKQHAVSRIVRNSNEDGQRRPFIAAHFHGNTSHLNQEVHDHYKGNGLVRVPYDAHHDVWYPAPWTVATPHPRPTLTRNGHVHVRHTGVYLVYVQIYYMDSHDVVSWVLQRTNSGFDPQTNHRVGSRMDDRETLLRCAQSAHSAELQDKANSCFSASALFLRAGDMLAVRNTRGELHSVMESDKSFIGLVKLADAEDPDQDL